MELKRLSSALWVTYVNIALYALCYQLQRPVEPFLVQKLVQQQQEDDTDGGLDVTQTYGRLQSFFSTVQTIGSPLVGILLDRVGIRKASALVFAASAASYLLLAHANTLPLLFASKIPTALQHAFLVAQAVAATSCPNNEAARAQALGRMTTAYTVGATIGPALGGYLAEHGDLYIGAQWAAIGSFLSVILSLVFLSDNTSTAAMKADQEDPSALDLEDEKDSKVVSLVLHQKRSFIEELQRSVEIAMRSALWPLLIVKVISGVASSMYDTTLPMVLVQQLHFDPAALGLNMSYSMLAAAAFGIAGIHSITKILGALGMAQTSLVVRPIMTCFMALVVSWSTATSDVSKTPQAFSSLVGIGSWVQAEIVTGTVLRSLASHALSTGLTTQTTGVVTAKEQGALLGLEHCLFSMARIVGPAMGTSLLVLGSFWGVAVSCGIVDVALLGVLVWYALHLSNGRKNKHP